MKKYLILAVLAIAAAGLAACAGGHYGHDHDHDHGHSHSAAELPAAKADSVIKYISDISPYQNWDLWPGKGKLYEGQHPHGAFLTTYVNESAAKALKNKAGELPPGAIVVKENYTPEKKLAAVTVMYKKAGYDPAAGNYYWLKYAPDGTVQKSGKVDGCINCHQSVKGNDWLFTGPIK